MIQTITTGSLKCSCCTDARSGIVNYILSPMPDAAAAIEAASSRFGISIVVIEGMDWDNALTPWPAKGQPPGSPDFKGEAAAFYDSIVTQVIPAVEKAMGIEPTARDLTGISLSGLFTVWQWMLHDTFHSVVSLSGSFWYEDFAQWISRQPVPAKNGKAYFSLGKQEPMTKVTAFKPVAEDTRAVIDTLQKHDVMTKFDWMPGGHYVDYTPRIIQAFDWLYSDTAL